MGFDLDHVGCLPAGTRSPGLETELHGLEEAGMVNSKICLRPFVAGQKLRGQLLPGIRRLFEIGVKGPDHAKPLTRGRLHYNPTANIGNSPGSEAFQACHFRPDIIGFDIQVNPARVVDFLHFYIQVFRPGFQAAVERLAGPWIGDGNQAERLGPECRSLVQIIRIAVDNKTTQLALVHHLDLPGFSTLQASAEEKILQSDGRAGTSGT